MPESPNVEQSCITCGRPATYRFEGREPLCATCPEPRPRTTRFQIPPRLLMGFPIVEVDDLELHDAAGPIAFGRLTGVWDDGRAVCVVCQHPFTPGPEGTGVLTHTTTGERVGPICPACGIAIESPDA